MAEKEKATSKKKKTSVVYKNYDCSGGALKRKNRTCPKCGSSVFMGKHKDRWACGKCKYTEFVRT